MKDKTDKKLVEIMEYALLVGHPRLLWDLSDALNKRAHFESEVDGLLEMFEKTQKTNILE